MPEKPHADFEALLKALAGGGVDFIVVGGVCAVLHGAPVTTFDLDIVHHRTPRNLDRLADVLRALGARYREHSARRVEPTPQALDSPGHHLLMTDEGPLDVLGSIADDRDFARLVNHSQVISLSSGLVIRVLDLPTLIEVKQQTDRERDRMMVAILKRIQAERGTGD